MFFEFEWKNDKPLCPICNSEMGAGAARNNQLLDIVCYKNKCFRFEFDHGEIDVRVFGKEFYVEDAERPIMPKGVKEEINYWKENERYLMKLLE